MPHYDNEFDQEYLYDSDNDSDNDNDCDNFLDSKKIVIPPSDKNIKKEILNIPAKIAPWASFQPEKNCLKDLLEKEKKLSVLDLQKLQKTDDKKDKETYNIVKDYKYQEKHECIYKKCDKNENSKLGRMCKFVMSGEFCNDNSCKFAHKPEELQPEKCKNNSFYSCKFSNCWFIHEEENLKQYCDRLNITWRPKITCDPINYDFLVDEEFKILAIRRIVPRYKAVVLIIGTENKMNVKDAPWVKFKNEKVQPEKVQTVEHKTERNDGYNILSDKDQVSNHLKKTKFCQIMIDQGKCYRKVCNFAHSVKEISFPDCAFKADCKKKDCAFKHPWEKLDDYKARINFKIPKNIR